MSNFIFGDFISCLNTAKRLHLKTVKVLNTKFHLNMLIILQKIGIIRGFTFFENKIEVYLKYVNNRCVFLNLKLVSIPSKKAQFNLLKLSKIKEKKNTSIYIISTNQGLKTDFECLLYKLSGEVILKIDL